MTNVAEFLDVWLQGGILEAPQQAVLNRYYHSYKKHFGPYLRHHYARQTKELIQAIGQLERPHVLEVGCGCGTESLWAAIKGAHVTGIDILPHMLEVAQARLKYLQSLGKWNLDCHFIQGNLLDLPRNQMYDLIFLENSFHHLEPREMVIRKLVELLHPGGRIIFVEGNGWSPLLQFQMFKLRGFKTIIEHQGHVWGNERMTVPWALIREFRRYSLGVDSLEYNRLLPNWKIADWCLVPSLKLPRWLAPVFTHYYLVLQKPPLAGLVAP